MNFFPQTALHLQTTSFTAIALDFNANMSPPPLANSSVLSVAQTSRAIPSASGILATPPLTPGAATTPAALAPPGASASTIAQATNTAATGTSAPINGAPTHTQYGKGSLIERSLCRASKLTFKVVARNFNVHDRQNDYTAFLASQATWSEHNLPPTMGQADLVWSQLKTGELRYLLDAAGQKIMGPRGKYLRDFGHILPDRIATNYEPWLDEVWRRMEPRLTHGDIRDRMFMGGTLAGPSNKPTPIRDNTQNQRAVRYRAKVGAFSTKNPRKNSDIQKCELAALDRMSGLQRQYNTTWIVVALENEEGMGMVQPIPADLSAPNYTGTIYPVSISGPGSTHSPNERMRARIAEENRLNNLATSGGLPDWKSLPPQTWADTRGHGDRKARQQASMVAAIAPGNETTRRVESERQSNATKFGNNGAPSDGPRAQPASSVMALGKRKADANECDTEKQVAKRTKGAVKCDQKPAETCQISPSVIRGRVTAKRDRVLRIPKTYKNTADVHSENVSLDSSSIAIYLTTFSALVCPLSR